MTDGGISPFPSKEQRGHVRESKKEAVLRTAVALFNERGFRATSLDDVAARLGVTKPVIYHYFGNKDQVLFCCLKLGMEQLAAAAEEARSHEGDSLDRLKAFLCRYAENNMDGFGRCVILTNDQELSDDSRKQFRALKRDIDQAMRRLIEEAADDGLIAVDDVRLTAFTIAGALSWVARWYDAAGPDSPATIAARMVETLVRGLAPR